MLDYILTLFIGLTVGWIVGRVYSKKFDKNATSHQ